MQLQLWDLTYSAESNDFLLLQIRYVCGETAPLPTAPSHLMEAFTDSLERLSVSKVEEGGTAVIVIDGADLIRVSITDFPSSVCVLYAAISIHWLIRTLTGQKNVSSIDRCPCVEMYA